MNSETHSTSSTHYTSGPLHYIPIVLRPRIISLKNRFCRRDQLSYSDGAGLLLTLTLMGGLYLCCHKTCEEWLKISGGGPFQPTLLSAVIAGLFSLILLSATVSGLSSFFMGQDIERFLASPISPVSFLWGKLCEVAISTMWMLLLFFVPLYLSIGFSFHAHVLYFVLAPVLVGVFLVSAVLAGVLLAITFAAIIPASIGRNIFVVLFIASLGVVLNYLGVLPGITPQTPTRDVGLENAAISFVSGNTTPSYWVAISLRALIGGEVGLPAIVCMASLSAASALWLALVFTFRHLYYRTLSRLHGQRTPLRILTSPKRAVGIRIGQTRNRHIKALITREFFTFTRDITHSIQLGMLLTICLLYLYSLQRLEAPTHVGSTTLQAWDMCAIFSSLVLSSIIILSICARFVFPSVSLEGHALWILQTAPMKSADILRAKHRCWFIPIALIGSVIFTSVGFALGLEPAVVAALAIIGITLSHGLVALGIGVGARFARFDWEHPTELSTSWGSLVYTLCGLLVVTLSLIPITGMFGLYIFLPITFQDRTNVILLLAFGLSSLGLLHALIAKITLRIGSQSLDNLCSR